MPRSTPTKQQLNQAIRTDVLGGDYLLDLFNYLYIVRRYDLTDECRGFLDFMNNRLTSIRARMREAVLARQNGTLLQAEKVKARPHHLLQKVPGRAGQFCGRFRRTVGAG